MFKLECGCAIGEFLASYLQPDMTSGPINLGPLGVFLNLSLFPVSWRSLYGKD